MKRQLAAILAADMVGYSRLMEADETGTVTRQKRHLSKLIKPTVAKFDGRIVKLMGDGMLAEFDSVIDAVRAAVDIQKSMPEREASEQEDRRIRYRIGINLGDVIHSENDIFGDGVNIAARLEEIAEPGGICLSGTAYDHLKKNIPIGYEALGELRVKNITQPVRVYRVLLDGETKAKERPFGWIARPTTAAAAFGCLAIAVAAIFWIWDRGPDSTGDVSVPPERIAPFDPDLPALAVLPFRNLNGDPEQAYFSDGITEDLITDLSKISGIVVLASNATFRYRDRDITARQVGAELGADYVLEGSVRRSSDRLRINAQLSETATGGNVWADRYDRRIDDVFALQDDVAHQIVDALHIKLNPGEAERLRETKTANTDAYDMLLRGLAELRRFSAETNRNARAYFERAIALDPGFARAHADLALTYALDAEQLWTEDPQTAARVGLDIGQRALRLDAENAQVHFVLSVVYRSVRQLQKSLGAAERAIALDPNYADGYTTLAISLNFSGNPEQALAAMQKANRLNPLQPFFYVWAEGQSRYLLGDYEAAAELFERVALANPHFPAAQKMLVATYVELNRIEDAQWAAHELLTIAPGFSLASERAQTLYADETVRKRYLAALEIAGIE